MLKWVSYERYAVEGYEASRKQMDAMHAERTGSFIARDGKTQAGAPGDLVGIS
jgi:hypothetical protein